MSSAKLGGLLKGFGLEFGSVVVVCSVGGTESESSADSGPSLGSTRRLRHIGQESCCIERSALGRDGMGERKEGRGRGEKCERTPSIIHFDMLFVEQKQNK